MTKSELMVNIAAIVTTLAEVPGGQCPKSQVYMMFGMDLEKCETTCRTLQALGFCEVSPETITLTSRGREVATKFNNLLKKQNNHDHG